MIYYVYIYYDENTPIYVGKGKGDRYKVHLKKSLKTEKGKVPFYDKLKKMNDEGKSPIIEIVENNLTEEEALLKEKEYYDKIGTIFKGNGTLLNYNECGVKNPILNGEQNPMFGKSLFMIWEEKYGKEIANEKWEIYRKKMSDSLKGRVHSDETKKKIKHKKQKYWDELSDKDKEVFKENISKSHTENRKYDSSLRMKQLNKKMTGSKHPKSKKCLIEGQIFESITEVCNFYGFKNHNTVRYRLNSDNFPEWKYID